MIPQQTVIAANSVEPYATWMTANTAFCVRMAARITVSACLENQQKSRFDNRCTGCVDLFDQETMTEVCPDLALIRALDRIIERAGGPKLPQQEDNSRTDTKIADDFENMEIDLDDEQLLKLFPELLCQKDDEDHEEVIERRFAEHQEPVKPRMFYSGTCKRCGGYVQDARERFENSFHCLICGWRTSPAYEANRRIQSKGAITV